MSTRPRRAVYTEIMTVFIVPTTTRAAAVGSGDEVMLTPGWQRWRPPRCGCGFLFIIFNLEANVDRRQPAAFVSNPNPGLPMAAAVSGSY